nr:MAG TPA: replisome organizer [Caudoviricetes sp.]
MFSLDVVDTDRFLEMPSSTQSLYFHFGMRADDDGFVSSPKKIATLCGCNTDDIKLLVSKGYLIPFDDGVVVITDWKANNYIKKDRYNKTIYQEHFKCLKSSGVSYQLEPKRIQNGTETDTQVRLGKDRLVQDSIGKDNICADAPKRTRSQFKPPTLEEVQAYCRERNNKVDAERFIDYYSSNGWMVGKNKMKDWKAAVRTWERNQYSNNAEPKSSKPVNGGNKSFKEIMMEMEQSEQQEDVYVESKDITERSSNEY